LLISWKRNSSPFPKPLSNIVSPQFLVVIINVYYEAEE
jgi:hypothetical protein